MIRTYSLLCGTACLVLTFVTATPTFARDEQNNELVQLVINLLREKDKDLRALGLEQVRSEAAGQAATEAFAAELVKLPPDAQIGLLGALANRGDGAARPAVLDIMNTTKDASVRAAAIAALGFLGRPADANVFVQLLADGSKTDQTAARQSLIVLRGKPVPGMIAAEMNRSKPALRVDLIEVLTSRRALETIPEIQKAAVDAEPTVRAAAMSSLGKLGGPEEIAGMVQGVLKAQRGREREAAEKCVMFVCGRIQNSDRRAAPLLTAMDKLNESDRLIMMSTLGRVGGADARKMIEAAVASRDAKTHEAGLKALCNWPNASVAPRLIELAKDDPHAAHRTTALRALVRIAPLPDGRSDAQKLLLLKQAMSMCQRDTERVLVLRRARAVRIPETLRFIMPYADQPRFAEEACESVVELAHHRSLRDPNKKEFDKALDKVIATSKDEIVIDRANRYKKGQTWVRPK